MRSIWKGSVSFGLVSIGVKLYAATEERSISFHQVRRTDGSRIRYRRVAEADGQEVSFGDIAKGYELSSGETVVLTDDDFADLPLPSTRVVDVLQFVPLEQIDPIYFHKSYFLEPEKGAIKPYLLLREALKDSDMAGLVKVAIRNREQLATLRVRDDVIVLETMIWPDEVREADFAFLDSEVELRPQERQMAASLLESMAGDFDPSGYSDDYREALEAVIEAKIEGREVVEAEDEQPRADNVVDLMSALRASVDAAKRSRGEAGSTSTVNKTTAKKSAAKKPAAKKPAAKKPAAKKPAAKKPAAKKPAGGKATAKKAPAKKQAVKTTATKTAAAKKTAAKKPAAKKTATKKTAAKSTARKSA